MLWLFLFLKGSSNEYQHDECLGRSHNFFSKQIHSCTLCKAFYNMMVKFRVIKQHT